MHSTYSHTLNSQFPFRDTEVNEGQVLDRALRFGNKGQRFAKRKFGEMVGGFTDFKHKGHQFTNEITRVTRNMAKKVAVKMPSITNKLHGIDPGMLPVDIAHGQVLMNDLHNTAYNVVRHVPDVVHNIAGFF